MPSVTLPPLTVGATASATVAPLAVTPVATHVGAPAAVGGPGEMMMLSGSAPAACTADVANVFASAPATALSTVPTGSETVVLARSAEVTF